MEPRPWCRVHAPNDRGAVKGKWANTVDDETSALDEGFQLLKDGHVDADDCYI